MTESTTPEPTPAVEQDDERQQSAGADDATPEAPRDDDSEGTDEADTDDDTDGEDSDDDDGEEADPVTV